MPSVTPIIIQGISKEVRPLIDPSNLELGSGSCLERDFCAGRYSEVVESFEKGLPTDSLIKSLHWIVGSYSYLGKVVEAQALFHEYENALSSDKKIAARYLIAVSLTRHLKPQKAKAYLLLNVRDARRSKSKESQIWALLGLAFFRYSYGRLEPASRLSQTAYAKAVALNQKYLSFIAADLLGHCLVNQGFVQQGLSILGKAQLIATELGVGAVLQAAETTRTLYRSTMGISIEPVQDLIAVREKLFFRDGYNSAQIGLELIRNLLLNGKASDAKAILDDVRAVAFESGNIRLQSLHQLRLAYYFYQIGEQEQAKEILAQSLSRIAQNGGATDLRLRLSLLGLAAKMGDISNLAEILLLTRKTNHVIARRILARENQVSVGTKPLMGEDPLGDLMDAISGKRIFAINEVVRQGRLLLLSKVVGLNCGENAIVFGLQKNSFTLVFRGDVDHFSEGITYLQRRFLEYIAHAPRTLHEIAENVWKEKFNPWRHERLVASFYSRLLRLSPLMQHIIVREEKRFGVCAGVKLVLFQPNVSLTDLPVLAGHSESLNVNYRQQALLQFLSSQENALPIAVSFYGEHFGVPRRTALRDLKDLVEKGLFVANGSGRATRYFFLKALGKKT